MRPRGSDSRIRTLAGFGRGANGGSTFISHDERRAAANMRVSNGRIMKARSVIPPAQRHALRSRYQGISELQNLSQQTAVQDS